MVLRNHGIVICGETIEEALLSANDAVKACKYQVILSFKINFCGYYEFYSIYLGRAKDTCLILRDSRVALILVSLYKIQWKPCFQDRKKVSVIGAGLLQE